MRRAAWTVWLIVLGLAGVGCRRAEQAPAYPVKVVSAMNRGVSLMGQYQYEEAVKAFEEAVREAPMLTDARINLAIALFNRNRQEDLAAGGKLLEEVLGREPGNVRALYFQAIIHQHVGKAELAIPCLTQVLQVRPHDGAVWYLLALCRQRLGQPAEAEFQKAIEYRPNLVSAYYQLYQIAMRADQEERARQFLERFKALRESAVGESLEFPQYNQMGELAMAVPLSEPGAGAVSRSQLTCRGLQVPAAMAGAAGRAAGVAVAVGRGGIAVGDLDGDGRWEFLSSGPDRSLVLHTQPAPEGKSSGAMPLAPWAVPAMSGVTGVAAVALGDLDNDTRAEVAVATDRGVRLFKSTGSVWGEVTEASGVGSVAGSASSVLLVDADHDGDLDLLVCGPERNQLWNNLGTGAFTNVAAAAGLECVGGGSVQALALDLDSDRDQDLVILREGGSARLFRNELLGRYQELPLPGVDVRGDRGGAVQDLDGDGVADLVVMGGQPARLQLWLGDGRGGLSKSGSLDEVSRTLDTWGVPLGFRVADLDLDGDQDVVTFDGAHVHWLLNDGRGRFVVQTWIWPGAGGSGVAELEVMDVTGDLVPDLVILESGASGRVMVAPGELVPPSTALAVLPTGVRDRDGRTRSPASGFGARLTLRAGLQEQRVLYSGLAGGKSQSVVPVVLGLGGAAEADYVRLDWPDGVAQVESELAAARVHRISELQRKISSCPVLFAWNSERFGFVTDFAGVGGLGYYVSPGESAPPQVEEHVKLEPGQLVPREGVYELRVAEPMEESAYLDRLELVAVDHAPGVSVYPDERLALSGAAPTHEWLVASDAWFPVSAVDPEGGECAPNLAKVDRVYAYKPALDRRYIGFCRPHTLELDFGPRLAQLDRSRRVFLFLHGFIEYPYSQTVYAAAQSAVGWEPIRVETMTAGGEWITVVPDAGVPGGMARMMTVDLTGLVPSGCQRLRLTTNLEVYYDQAFVAQVSGPEVVRVQTVPLKEATLRYLGFPKEHSPDGGLPLIYDYEACEATAPFHVLKGAYTRYGPVVALLAEYDDRYVVMGPGDEVVLRFDAAALGETKPGEVRSFILVSHAYCKDMDLYTATPQTLEPLPHRGMSRYPYGPEEHYPEDATTRRYQQEYNTRRVE